MLKVLLSLAAGGTGWLGLKIAALLAGSGLAGVLTPLVTAAMAVLKGIVEIVTDLSKSFEGRVILALIAAAAGFLYLRFHYIEQGRALETAQRTVLIQAAVRKQCGEPREPRRRLKVQDLIHGTPGAR